MLAYRSKKQIASLFALALLFLLFAGCAQTGYRVTIEAEGVEADAFAKVVDILVKEGFVFRENTKQVVFGKKKGGLYLPFYKQLGDGAETFIAGGIAKGQSDVSRFSLKVILENWYTGSRPIVRTEIDRLSTIVEETLRNQSIPAKVQVRREELVPEPLP